MGCSSSSTSSVAPISISKEEKTTVQTTDNQLANGTNSTETVRKTHISQEPSNENSTKKNLKKEVTVRIKEDGNPEVPGYKLLNILGRGSFGITQKACSDFDESLENKLFQAIKIVDCKRQTKEEKSETMNEAKNLFLISQQETPISLVKFFHALFLNEVLMIIMEYCPNGTMEQLIKKQIEENKHFEEKELKEFSKHLLNGLSFIHNLKMIHRDIKPANILFSKEMTPKIADFGIVKKVGEKGVTSTSCGSPKQMAPELLEGRETYDNKVDIWGMGLVFLEMSCFTWSLTRIMKGDWDDVKKIQSAEWVEVISKMLDLDPKTRFSVPELLKLSFFTGEVIQKKIQPEVIWHDGVQKQTWVAVGQEATGDKLQLTKAVWSNAIQIGKMQKSWRESNTPIGGKEIKVNKFWVYGGLNDGTMGVWVESSGGKIPKHAIPMGRDEKGKTIQGARAKLCGGVHPGSLIEGTDHAKIPYGGGADEKEKYEVLCYEAS